MDKVRILTVGTLLVSVAALSSAPVVAQEDLKIGVAQTFDGPSAYYGEASWKGMQVAAEIINERGGVNGRKFNFIVEDDQGKPATGISAIRKLEQQKVLALVGPTRTIAAIAAAPVANELKMPLIAQNSGGKWPESAGSWVFKLAMPTYEQGPLMKAVVDKFKPKTMSIMYDSDDEAAVSAFNSIKDEAQKANLKIVATEAHRASDVDLAPQITRIKAANPDIFYYASKAETGGLIIRTARERGITAPIVAWPAVGGIEKVAGQTANGVITQAAIDPDSDDPVVKEFVGRFHKKFGATASIDQYNGYGYDAILLLADAVKRAGPNVDRQSLRDAIAATKNLKATTGTLSWDGADVQRANAAVLKMDNGKWVVFK
jgi:branched-chain amino acid transport system substrate-binding protein